MAASALVSEVDSMTPPTIGTSAPKVFISYASPDLPQAQRLNDDLQQRNIATFFAPHGSRGPAATSRWCYRGSWRSLITAYCWSLPAPSTAHGSSRNGPPPGVGDQRAPSLLVLAPARWHSTTADTIGAHNSTAIGTGTKRLIGWSKPGSAIGRLDSTASESCRPLGWSDDR